jgi:hypothetical protein
MSGPPKAKTFSAKSNPPAWRFKNVRLFERHYTSRKIRR